METGLFIVSLIIGIMVVNGANQLFMKMIGASSMRFSVKGRMIQYTIATVIIFGLLGTMFGIVE